MTAQIQDVFRYRDEDFHIAGISTGTLFEPSSVGLRPVPASSACWRGYCATYAVHDARLVLTTLHISSDTRDEDGQAPLPAIDGRSPRRATGRLRMFSHIYDEMTLRVPYTGGLLLGREFIEALYVHMGFHPGWKYRVVHELEFEDGRLVAEHDRSQEMADLRARAAEHKGRGGMLAFVKRAFDRRYRRR